MLKFTRSEGQVRSVHFRHWRTHDDRYELVQFPDGQLLCKGDKEVSSALRKVL